MIIFRGTANRTRTVRFGSGPATFVEAIVQHADRAAEVFEIRIPEEMDASQFAPGTSFEIVISLFAKNSRIYLSAVKMQPDGYPRFAA